MYSLLFIVSIILFVPLYAPAQSIYFDRLNTDNGLSNNSVYEIIQDREGFLWFATDDGLNLFDGYEFKIFRDDPDDDNSLSGNSIWSLKEDSKGNIWIGTKSGWLNCYDPVTNKFKKWRLKSEVIKENTITVIQEDNKNRIWIGTYRSGLYRLDPSTEKIDHWLNDPHDNTSLSNNYISSILQDNENNLWISTYNGLNRFNPQSSPAIFTHFFNEPGNPNSISNNVVWYLTKSKSDPSLIWIGTADGLTSYRTDNKTFTQIQIPNPDKLQFGTSAGSVIEDSEFDGDKILWIDSFAGLIRMNINNGDFTRFTSDKNDLNSLSSNQINRIFKDRSGVLWLATDNGLSFFSSKSTKFNSTLSSKYKFMNPGYLNSKNIRAIATTPDGKTWFGTDQGLYYSVHSAGKNFIKQDHQSGKLNIWSLTSDNKGNLWIGTYGLGLFRLNMKTNQLIAVSDFEKNKKSPAVKFNKVVYCDDRNNIWIGFWGLGLVQFNPKNGTYKHWFNETNNPNSLSHNDVWVIHQDANGRIWIGTNGGGLNLFDKKNGGQFYRWSVNKNKPGNISSNSIYSICEARKRNTKSGSNENTSIDNDVVLWIGTNKGLNKFVVKNSAGRENGLPPEVKITAYSLKDGLSDNSINSIVEDNAGNLWLGTSSGITMYNPEKNKFTNYGRSDGIIGRDINFSSASKTEDGIILMGSKSGLNYFNPENIVLSSFVPPVLITELQIFNESVEPGENSILSSSIFHTTEIILSHTQNVFSFQFSALDYTSPLTIKYAYKMEGFDGEWIYSGSRRFVTYTNLNPGKYIFKVRSSNSDGIWNDNHKELNVIITPPWWQTSWAISMYALIFILGVWGIIKFQIYRAHLQQELKIQEFEAHHLREIENMKSRFFANLSHEFRTPLMLIKGPLEQLISGRIKDNLLHYYKMLLRNTEKLQHLIDQLLELSQLEAETIPLNKQKHELVNLLKGFTYSFMPLAEQNDIALSFNSSVENLIIMIDKDKVEKIINNLLSNAFKCTPAGGNIYVDLTLENNTDPNIAKIIISDTGIGIPDEYQNKIFNRFYRVEDTSHGNYTGSGIGLALVKELITLHKWDIAVQSKEGEGSKFIIKIPLEDGYETENNNIVPGVTTQEISRSKVVSSLVDDPPGEENASNKKSSNKPIILFVEDSYDVRNYVYDLFKEDYKVLLAEKAEEAIMMSLKDMPDLILSDIMMPGMDGIEFCHRVKTNWQTSHIPVILLTAKATEDNKIEGLETGADDYLTKPFNYEELAIRIKNLIEQRKHLREKFSKEINLKPGVLTGNSLDKEFINKVLCSAEKNMHNSDFNTELLAQELFVSRRQLHRKLLAITGQGPGEFIRILRLKKAAQMLIENKLSVTQIAYEVGFESPAQFTRAFKKHFNCLPSEFSHKHKN